MGNNILWYQPAVLSDEDVVIYNGKSLPLGTERTQRFKELHEVAERVTGKKRPWCGKIGSYFFVKGSFNQLDEKGRPLSFMFASDEKDGKTALLQELKLLNLELADSTIECIYQKTGHNTLKTACVVVAIAILLLLVCNMIVDSCNN